MEQIYNTLVLRPELLLLAIVVGMMGLWLVTRRLSGSDNKKKLDGAPSPQVSSPGSIHQDWFDGVHQRLDALGARESSFATSLENMRAALLGEPAEKAIAALQTTAAESQAMGWRLLASSEQQLLGAAVARLAAGDLETTLHNVEGALENYRLAIEAIPPGHDALMMECLNKHGAMAYRAEKYDASLMSFKRAVKLIGRIKGGDSPDVASVLNNLAMLHQEKGEAHLARPLYERALQIDEVASGDKSRAVATDLNNLGLLLKSQAQFEEAEPLLQRALAIKEQILEPGDPALVTGLRNYAALLRAMGREDEATELDVRLG